MNEVVLKKAKDGIFPLTLMHEYEQSYLKAGGAGTFTDYYAAKYDHAIVRQSLKKNLIFSHHNLVTGGSFNERNVIVCRNVMATRDPRAVLPAAAIAAAKVDRVLPLPEIAPFLWACCAVQPRPRGPG